jgi:gamma-glutamyltranspeptidase/glutathione hydrolase
MNGGRVSMVALSAGCALLLGHVAHARKLSLELSPAAWQSGELERFTALQNTFAGPTPPPIVAARRAVITGTSSPLAVRSGYEALARGGNAADAALTAALAQVALVAGSYVSYAGIFFLTYYDAAEHRVYYLNAGFDTPRAELDPLSIPASAPSGRTALVPGFFAGVAAAHQRFGSLPFATLFEPALYFAEQGFEFNALLAAYISVRKDVLGRLPEARSVFVKPDGEFYSSGDWFTQPALAETLRQVALDGIDTIYTGDWAQHFVDAIRREGGVISLDDMSAYRVIWSEPLHTRFRDYELFSAGLPSLGGVNLVEAFNVLEAAGFPERGDYATDPEALFWFMQIQRLLALGLLSPASLEQWLPGVDLSPASRSTKATAAALWQAMEAGNLPLTSAPRALPTHSDALVVMDDQGNVAALTHTINTEIWGLSGIFVDGISIPDAASFQQQRMLDIGPGARLPEEIDPTIVFRDGCPIFASSSIGVTHYASLPFLYGVLGYDLDLENAALRPHLLLPDFSTFPGRGVVERVTEGLFPADVIEGVRALGQSVELIAPYAETAYRGYVVGVGRDNPSGHLSANVPPYLNGVALGD